MEEVYNETIIKMRLDGKSYATIVKETGCRERHVRAVCKGITKTTPFDACVNAVYLLATREEGCKQYELMESIKSHYGVEWNGKEGKYEHTADEEQRKRVRAAVVKKAAKEETTAVFVPNWMDTSSPSESNSTMLSLSLSLQDRLNEAVEEYMLAHGNSSDDDSVVYQQARSARREILALAFPGFAPEGVGKRLERNTSTVDKLLGTPDIEIKAVQSSKDGVFSEPSNVDPFCDYVEEMGWIQFNICGEGEK